MEKKPECDEMRDKKEELVELLYFFAKIEKENSISFFIVMYKLNPSLFQT